MVAGLYSGTVTFLFTDVEGSTRLLRELGDEFGGLLEEHHRILRDAVTAGGGTVIDTQGDGMFAAFPRVQGAVRAATEAQEAFARMPLRVRMGIHTGEPLVEEGRYVGLDVHRAKRIGDAAHGGQVLLSDSARALLPEGVVVKGLGAHALKDFDQPQRLYQLGGAAFPPPRTGSRRRRAPFVAAGIAIVVAAVAAAVVLNAGKSERPVSVSKNSVAVIDPKSDRVVGDVRVGYLPRGMAFGAGGVWVANAGDETVTGIDTETLKPFKTYGVGGEAVEVATLGRTLWVATSGDDTIVRVDTRSGAVQTTKLPNGTGATSVTTGGGAVWVGESTVYKLDPATGAIVQKAPIDCCIPADLLYTPTGIWTNGGPNANLIELSPRTLRQMTSIVLGSVEFHFAYGAGAVWVSTSDTFSANPRPPSWAWKIDPTDGNIVAKTPVGAFADDIAFGYGAVWVANRADGTISKLDPATARVVATIRIGQMPSGLTVGGGRVWVSVQ